jgi:hypothetical protein
MRTHGLASRRRFDQDRRRDVDQFVLIAACVSSTKQDDDLPCIVERYLRMPLPMDRAIRSTLT